MNITIRELLAKRHEDDIFIEECKTGSSGRKYYILDAWAMRKTWQRPFTTGYEIKTHRSDFLQDDKWLNYLDYCNMFYFVCPSGLIQPDELPPEAGLLYQAKTGSRLFTKKKAPYRENPIPVNILIYILMWRAKITNEPKRKFLTDKEYWEHWLEEKQLTYELGKKVSKELKETINDKIKKVKEENEQLIYEIQKYKELEQFLKNNNLNIKDSMYRIKRTLEKTNGLEVFQTIDNTISKLERLKETLEKGGLSVLS